MIVPEQSESASFATLVEIHNVDVRAASNHVATVLSPTTGTLQWHSLTSAKIKWANNSCRYINQHWLAIEKIHLGQ